MNHKQPSMATWWLDVYCNVLKAIKISSDEWMCQLRTDWLRYIIWYLNDVKDGGYTEFIDGTRIQPEAGKLIIFPSTWDFLHRGVSPKTETKYLCTGWVHAEMMEGW